MKDLLIHSRLPNSFLASNVTLRLGFMQPFKHVVFYSLFNVVVLECLNNGHISCLVNILQCIFFLLLMYRQFHMKTVMKESTNISGRSPLAPFCPRRMSISLQLKLQVPFNAPLNVLQLLF